MGGWTAWTMLQMCAVLADRTEDVLRRELAQALVGRGVLLTCKRCPESCIPQHSRFMS